MRSGDEEGVACCIPCVTTTNCISPSKIAIASMLGIKGLGKLLDQFCAASTFDTSDGTCAGAELNECIYPKRLVFMFAEEIGDRRHEPRVSVDTVQKRTIGEAIYRKVISKGEGVRVRREDCFGAIVRSHC